MPTTTIDAAEWQAVHEALHVVDPPERTSTAGLAVMTGAGRRRWLAWNQHVTVATTPVVAAAGVDLNGMVSPRLVTYAHRLAHLDGQTVLTLDGETSSVSAASGSLVLGRPQAKSVPEVGTNSGLGVVAQVRAGALLALLEAAGELPTGLEPKGPPFWFSVGANQVGAEVDWTIWLVPAAQFSIPADTNGSPTRVAVDHRVLTAVVALAQPDDDLELVVPAGGRVIRIVTGRWTAEVRTVDFTAEAWRADIDAVFHDAAFPHEVTDDGSGGWSLDAWGTQVHAQLRDGPVEHVVRLTVKLATGVAGTTDVLTEINALCAGLVNVRVWWENATVLAATDVPCPAAEMIVTTAVENLVDQVNSLGPLVGALAEAA